MEGFSEVLVFEYDAVSMAERFSVCDIKKSVNMVLVREMRNLSCKKHSRTTAY